MPQPIICCKNSEIVPLPFACLPTASFHCPRVCHSTESWQGCVLYCSLASATPCPSWDSACLYLGHALPGENRSCLGVGLQWSVWAPSNSGYSTVLWGGVEKGEKSASFSKIYQLCCIQIQAWNICTCKASHRKRDQQWEELLEPWAIPTIRTESSLF